MTRLKPGRWVVYPWVLRMIDGQIVTDIKWESSLIDKIEAENEAFKRFENLELKMVWEREQ